MKKIIVVSSILAAVVLAPSTGEARMAVTEALYGTHRATINLERPTSRSIYNQARQERQETGDQRRGFTDLLRLNAEERRRQRQQENADEMTEDQIQDLQQGQLYRRIYPGNRLRYGGRPNRKRFRSLYFDLIPDQGY